MKQDHKKPQKMYLVETVTGDYTVQGITSQPLDSDIVINEIDNPYTDTIEETNPPQHEKLLIGTVPKEWITDHELFINEKGEVYAVRHVAEDTANG
jgi:hypothetical protein